MRIVTVIGTRPQYVKYAALQVRLKQHFAEILVDTGQHYDHHLSGQLIAQLCLLPATYHLGVTPVSGVEQLGDMLEKLAPVLRKEKPDAVLCMGDTNSTLATALCAAKLDLPVVHLEAGERSFTGLGCRVSAPFTLPEEMNRILTDHVSSLLLCASTQAIANLQDEKVNGRAEHTGDILYDLYLAQREDPEISDSVLRELGLGRGEFYYCTIHRAINTDRRERLQGILQALEGLDKPVVVPLHPRTRNALSNYGLLERVLASASIRVLDPVTYRYSLILTQSAARVLTDSGGVLREAYFAQVPSVCLDDSTAWIDVVRAGWSAIVGANPDRILDALALERPRVHPPIFGDGTAVERTVAALKAFLNSPGG